MWARMMTEVQLGGFAMDRATSKPVAGIRPSEMAEITETKDVLQAAASKKRIALPTDLTNEEADVFGELRSGGEGLRQAAGKDPDLQAFA